MLFDIFFTNQYIPFEQKVIIFLTFTFAVISALTLHEFAHAYTANKLGDNTAKLQGRLSINPMVHLDPIGILCFLFLGFGWAKPVPVNTYNFSKIKRDTFLVSISGICVNIILAFIFYPLFILLARVANQNIFYFILFCLCLYMFDVNLVFCVFNLLPIYPLDGFNAIAAYCKYDNPFVVFMYKYGSIILLFVVILFSYLNVFDWLISVVGYPISWFWGLILG